MATRKKGSKSKSRDGRLNLLIDPDLKNWIKWYAEQCNTTVTALIITYFKELRAQEDGVGVEQI